MLEHVGWGELANPNICQLAKRRLHALGFASSPQPMEALIVVAARHHSAADQSSGKSPARIDRWIDENGQSAAREAWPCFTGLKWT